MFIFALLAYILMRIALFTCTRRCVPIKRRVAGATSSTPLGVILSDTRGDMSEEGRSSSSPSSSQSRERFRAGDVDGACKAVVVVDTKSHMTDPSLVQLDSARLPMLAKWLRKHRQASSVVEGAVKNISTARWTGMAAWVSGCRPQQRFTTVIVGPVRGAAVRGVYSGACALNVYFIYTCDVEDLKACLQRTPHVVDWRSDAVFSSVSPAVLRVLEEVAASYGRGKIRRCALHTNLETMQKYITDRSIDGNFILPCISSVAAVNDDPDGCSTADVSVSDVSCIYLTRSRIIQPHLINDVIAIGARARDELSSRRQSSSRPTSRRTGLIHLLAPPTRPSSSSRKQEHKSSRSSVSVTTATLPPLLSNLQQQLDAKSTAYAMIHKMRRLTNHRHDAYNTSGNNKSCVNVAKQENEGHTVV